MAECTSPKQLAPVVELTLSQCSTLEESCSQEDAETIEMKMDDQGRNYIEVSCGELNGVLYLEKLRKMAGAKGMNKCILFGGSMMTPSEFEVSGGKKANRAWKKSIKHKNKPLTKYFALIWSPKRVHWAGIPLPYNPTAAHSYSWKGYSN